MALDLATDTELPPVLTAAFGAETPAENDNVVPVDWDHLGPILLKLARWDGLGL
jgi:hypothetical protein